MSLPEGVMAFLNENAQREGKEHVNAAEDLFKTGVLDSFALIDFVTVLEEHCNIKVPDSDVNPANFQTLEAIEHYVGTHKGN